MLLNLLETSPQGCMCITSTAGPVGVCSSPFWSFGLYMQAEIDITLGTFVYLTLFLYR